MIDLNFKMYSDANGRDPDAFSPTLRLYHKLLWSKPLPLGEFFNLRDDTPNHYLHHSSVLGDFSLGSDSISHSYRKHARKKWLTTQIPNEVQELFEHGSTIGGYIIFPNRKIDRKPTINQARGFLRLIDDRFDLTLECIRRFYIGKPSPLGDTLERYHAFFRLFGNFGGYVRFFLLDDLVSEDGLINFYLPFDDFQTPPEFINTESYLTYKGNLQSFIASRNQRIKKYANFIQPN